MTGTAMTEAEEFLIYKLPVVSIQLIKKCYVRILMIKYIELKRKIQCDHK